MIIWTTLDTEHSLFLLIIEFVIQGFNLSVFQSSNKKKQQLNNEQRPKSKRKFKTCDYFEDCDHVFESSSSVLSFVVNVLLLFSQPGTRAKEYKS